ncbi:ferric reductase-like transmembrane domain-containing protein [Nocardia miyunensis]|uniref:ferric reductase-like transmembrane domain-containing protein n=1 Tax=Nocardia miyunensis TaxID=282684 RepID=UPI00082F1F27|nr:ferric reductase-like transmembrane domain-containing protein [Nocardia miyunensis]
MTQALWALGRGSGIAALVVLTVAVVVGIAARSGRAITLPRSAIAELHRGASLIACALVGIHVLSLLADPDAQLRLIDIVLPFVADYRPVWLGLGTVAVDLLLAVVVSALLRHRLGPRTFRLIHWAAYGLWPVALIHSLGTGTDAARPWLLTVAGVCILAVAGAVTWRVGANFTEFGRIQRRSAS